MSPRPCPGDSTSGTARVSASSEKIWHKSMHLKLPGRVRPGVPGLSLSMHPFSISTDEHVPVKYLMTGRLSKMTNIHLIFNRMFRILELQK